MANMELITSVTVGSGGASSVTLPATGTIPQTYTDLKIVASVRGTASTVNQSYTVTFNGSSTTGLTMKRVYGNGASAASDSNTTLEGVGSTATASTFSNDEIYIPNYAGSNNKSFSVDNVGENNATTAYALLQAGLRSNTDAITSIVLTSSAGNFAEGSTFYLYGISNVTSTTKATGGIVSSDGTYNYHTFPFSGTFTPTVALTCDYLVLAGGGGGGNGGGGAGGYRTSIGGSPLSLTTQAYPIVVGAGGGAGGFYSNGTNGGDSSISGSGFTTITSTGGGYGGAFAFTTGATGGSGGGGAGADSGGALTNAGTGNSPSTSPSQGNNGGNGWGQSTEGGGGGGGGYSAVGSNASIRTGGNGGAGIASSISGQSLYYAGGGGGGGVTPGGTSTGGVGGSGVGGNGGGMINFGTRNGSAAVINSGSGGGGGGYNAPDSPPTGVAGAGGSGLVIIRYAI